MTLVVFVGCSRHGAFPRKRPPNLNGELAMAAVYR
jgi:hypothetical protein